MEESLAISGTPVTRIRITRTPPLAQTESKFPWIRPNFSVTFTRLLELGDLENPANSSLI